ncbi:Uncharacterised protein [uncultured archaeon]|nr:Uncharacterised protein [uncultured archaeon]
MKVTNKIRVDKFDKLRVEKLTKKIKTVGFYAERSGLSQRKEAPSGNHWFPRLWKR